MSKTVKASIWFIGCNVLQKGISFITTPIFTRIMTTEQFGLYNTYLSWLGIFTVFCTLNMSTCVYINAISKNDNEEERDRLGLSYLSLTFVITVVLLGVYLLFARFVNPIIGLPTGMFVLMFIDLFLQQPIGFWTVKQRYQYKYVLLVIVTMGSTVVNALAGILFVLAVKETQEAFARILSVILVEVVFGGGCYIYYMLRSHRLFSVRDWKHALRVQLPLVPHGLSITILSSADRIMINSMVGASAAGIYSVAYSVGLITKTFKDSIVEAIKPWVYEEIKKNRVEEVRRMIKSIIWIWALIAFTIMALGPEIILLMGGVKYYEAVNVIPPVIASTFFTFLFNIFVMFELYYEQVFKIMAASVIGAVLNIVLNFLLIPVLGYVVAGYTTLICYILFCAAHYVIVRNICKKKMNTKNIVSVSFLVVISLIVLAAVGLFLILYQHPLIRYAVLLGLVIIAFVLRKSIMEKFKSIRKRAN